MIHLTPRVHRADYQITGAWPCSVGGLADQAGVDYQCTRCTRVKIKLRPLGVVYLPDPKARERWR